MKLFKIALLILTIGCSNWLFAQTNSQCANATPFCTGQTMNFPAGVNAGSAQSGPNYGCLFSQPNPAWFFMQMANSGSMSIVMSSQNDIDFICWGPFPSMSGACSNLTANNIQSCSYSGSATETCTIANAVPGQFYLMLITNYSNQTQNISFNQNNASNPGAATTNCGFVCVVSASVTPIMCAGGAATISLGPNTSTAVTSFTWTGPGFTSNIGTNVLYNVQNNATYTLTGTSSALINGVPYTGTCQAVTTVSVVQYPSFSVTPTTTNICQGGNFFASVTFTPVANPNNYSYHWSPFSGAGVWQPAAQTTLISPLLLPVGNTLSTVYYSVTVSPNTTLVSCPITKTLAVTINNPLTPTINIPPPLCDVFAPIQLTATPGGGTWSANPAITSAGIFTPGLASIGTSTVSYAVSVGTCIVANTQTVSVSKFYSPALTSSISTLCVQDPVFNLMNIVQNTLTGSWSGPQVANNLFDPSTLATGNYNLTYSTTSLPNPSVCPAFTVLSVPVFNPPVPVITAIVPKCTNATTLALTATPSGGVWSGAQGVSPQGIQTPSANLLGTNTVIYTAGLGTCVASSSATFHVSQYNPATLTGTIPNLCVSSNPINLMGIVQNTNGVWSSVNGVYSNNLFDPANLPTNIYTLIYTNHSSPDPSVCTATTTINVSVLNPPPPNIAQAGPFCTADGTVQLSVTPAIGHWVASSFLSSTGTFSPNLSPVGNNVVQYIIGTSTCNSQQSKVISTEAFISAGITAKLADQCTTGQQVSLVPNTLNNTGNWSGNGIVGTNFDPALSGAGKFTLTYKTASIPSGLCPDMSTLSVNVFSLATPSIAKAGPFCNLAQPFQLQVSPVGGLFGSGPNGMISSGGLFNPALAIIGDNIVSYSISSGPCIANTKALISVEKFISADFGKYADLAYCVNSPAFNLVSLVQNPGGIFGADAGVLGTMFDPAKANLGINTVTYQTHSYPSALLCPDTKTINILVKKVPTTSASSNIYSGCAPVEVSLNSPAGADGIGTWNLGDGTGTVQALSASHIFTTPGSYTVVFNYADSEAKGCSTQVVLKAIDVYETPKADFVVSPDEITIANPEVSLTNLSTTLPNNRYTWTIEGLNQVYLVNPVVTFPQAGNYKVTLTATTIEGCKSEMTRIVEVKNDFSAYIPNSFTPNYDGLNDTFKPVFSMYGLDTKTYSLEIFDRWGHLLFSTTDFTKGWDGTVQNKGDTPLKEDVYVFSLKYKDLNGQVYSKIGDVTLLK